MSFRGRWVWLFVKPVFSWASKISQSQSGTDRNRDKKLRYVCADTRRLQDLNLRLGIRVSDGEIRILIALNAVFQFNNIP